MINSTNVSVLLLFGRKMNKKAKFLGNKKMKMKGKNPKF